MKQSNTSKYAYAAGIIDGEGCIRIYKNYHPNKPNKSTAHILEIAFGQNEGKIIDWFMGNFGGRIDNRQKVGMWYWRLNSKKAAELLKHLLPFLKRKKKEAEIALQFANRLSRPIKEKRPDGRWDKLSLKEIEIRDDLMQKLSQEKYNLHPPQSLKSALVETKRDNSSMSLIKTFIPKWEMKRKTIPVNKKELDWFSGLFPDIYGDPRRWKLYFRGKKLRLEEKR